jgi:hypothetical protein
MARSDSGIKVVAEWLKFYKIPHGEITALKPNADYFIDDKAIHFDSWDETLRTLNRGRL